MELVKNAKPSSTEAKSSSSIKQYPKWSMKNVHLVLFIWGTINIVWTIKNTTNYIFLMVGQFLTEIPMFIPFGNPLYPSFMEFVLYVISMIAMFLVLTKIDESLISEMLGLMVGNKSIGSRKVFFIFKPLKENKVIKTLMNKPVFVRSFAFIAVLVGLGLYLSWYMSAPIYLNVIPFFLTQIATLDLSDPVVMILVGNPVNLLRLFMFIPFIVILLVALLLWSEFSKYKESFLNGFKDYKFSSRWLQKKIINNGLVDNKMDKANFPDIVVGPNSKTNELVILPGMDRTLNNLIVGSIGTGKTAALVLPIINQDLHWMTRFINQFPTIHKFEDYKSESVQGMYLNGMSIIEPSNDLCQKAYNLVKAHGIPEEAVFYIDPLNPDTPNINAMQGPVEKVSEQFAMVMEGLAEGGNSNYFFQQSERNHLKHYIYLLKLHRGDDQDNFATFDMLIDMYNNAQLVRHMHVQLKETFPDVDIDEIKDRDLRNHWKIVQQIDEWFDTNLLPRTTHKGDVEKVRAGKYRGEEEYYDAKSEFVQGLRNMLNDISSNKLLRRVLFGHSDFDMDRHLEYGGVLLVNTAKGELGELSNVLGKLVLLSLQNAVFRRTPAISSFHHIIVDEFPDYIYAPFKEFPAQSRKYKTIVTVVAQTIAQLADKYGEYYMHTLLGTLRNKMVYGDIPFFDAQVFSNIFGHNEKYEEGTQEQEISPLQDDPTLRTGSSYTRLEDVILTPNDIISQREFQAAVKIVKANRPMPVVQIDANFVPKEQFKQAVFTVETDAGEYWNTQRTKRYDEIESGDLLSEPVLEVNESETVEEDYNEHEVHITEIPMNTPQIPYPVEYNEEDIKQDTEKFVQFPAVVSQDRESAKIVDELKEIFSDDPSNMENRSDSEDIASFTPPGNQQIEDTSNSIVGVTHTKEPSVETRKSKDKDTSGNDLTAFGIFDAEED